MLLENNNVTAFDVDGTMVIWPKDYREKAPGRQEFDYGGGKIYLTPYQDHITFLKHCYLRGDCVILWSKNGYSWAEQVAQKLGIKKYITLIMSKPCRHIDDKENVTSIVGERIFIGNPKK